MESWRIFAWRVKKSCGIRARFAYEWPLAKGRCEYKVQYLCSQIRQENPDESLCQVSGQTACESITSGHGSIKRLNVKAATLFAFKPANEPEDTAVNILTRAYRYRSCHSLAGE